MAGKTAPEAPHIAVQLRPPAPRHATLHVGPTNSGKTHTALEHLARARRGAYLAPLRLLAWEAVEHLEESGCPTTLLTGEEYIPAHGARAVAATVEMFPRGRFEVVVIDEAQMVADPDRGWAWTRALASADTEHLHVCCAPHAEAFLSRFLAALGDSVTVMRHGRLVPLRPMTAPVKLVDLPPRSAVITFSRRGVLRWKAAIEQAKKSPVAVVYGALPPDVRREQARRVRDGETLYMVSTDAIGMGLNFPVDHVLFADAAKYDGSTERLLRSDELFQIAGRAGRYGLSSDGWFGGLSRGTQRQVLAIASEPPQEISHAYVQPTLDELSRLDGRLSRRIEFWRHHARFEIAGVLAAPLNEMHSLALRLPRQLDRDLHLSYILATAPVSRQTMDYWERCASAAANLRPLPPPTAFPSRKIRDDRALSSVEQSLREHELCMWLAHRAVYPETPDMDLLRANRDRIARIIEHALSSRVVFGGCSVCGRPLSPRHPYGMCEDCHSTASLDYFSD